MARKLNNVKLLSYDSNENLRRHLSSSKFYIGLTKDFDGWTTYGVEYAAMEAMDCGCIPIIYDEMEYEYRRQGVRAAFVGDAPLSGYLTEIYRQREYWASTAIEHNYKFLEKKNTRFLSHLRSIIEEFNEK